MKRLNMLIIILFSFLLSGCLEPKLPKCDNKDVQKILRQMKSENQSLFIVGFNSIVKEKFQQLQFDRESKIRLCKAAVYFSDHKMGWIYYKIFWNVLSEDDLKKEFFVEVTDAEYSR